MKQLVWSPSSINFGSRKKGESVTAESTLSITEGSVLLTPGKISPVPWAGYPVQLKNTEGSLHIHPAFSFAAAKYYLTSAGALTTNRDIAELYLGNAGAGAGLPFLPVPITLVILTPPGEFDPVDPVTVNYTSGAILWVKVFFKINDSEWFFYDTFNATGTFDIDLSGWSFDHGDVLTVKVQDDESESFYDTVAFTAMVATITIDSINGGLPLTYEGLFEDGMWYFADTTGTKVVDQNDPDRSEWFIGTGNADGDIDLDIKMLAITDVVVPETVQLGAAFDVSGNYVMLEPRIVIEAFDGVTWVKLHVGDYIEVADGSFTESVTLQSADGFTVNSSVTVRVRSYDGYALNGIDSTDVIATVTINTPTLTAGTEGNVTGTSNGVEVDVYYRVSSPEGAWEVFEEGVAVSGGNWSATGTIADADTYDFRARDTVDPDGFAQVDDVVVASGVALTALQITNSTTAVSPTNINMQQAELLNDGNMLVAVGTTSDKINIKGIDYETGVDAIFTQVAIIIKINKNQEIAWVRMFKRYGTYGNIFALDNSKNIYTVEHWKDGSYRRTYCRKLNYSDGNTVTSKDLPPYTTESYAYTVGFDGANVHCFGGINFNYGQAMRWTLPTDLSAVTSGNYGGSSSLSFWRTLKLSGTKCFGDQWGNRLSGILLSGGAYKESSYTSIAVNRIAISNNRLLVCENSKGNVAFNMKGIDVAVDNVSYLDVRFRHVYNENNSSVYVGACSFDGTYFNAFYNDGSKFIIRKIDDADAYTKIGDDIEVTPNSINLGIRSSYISQDSTHYLIGGAISGNMEAGFVPGDNTKYDAFIKLVAK